MKKKISIKYIFFITCIFLLLFQNLIQAYIPFAKYFDEILSLLALPIFIFKIKNKYIVKKYNIYMIILYLILILTGLYSSIKYRYQPLFVALSDLLLVSKFFLTYSLSEMLFDIEFINCYKNKIVKVIRFIILIFFILTIFNYLFKIWPQNDYRFGIMSNQIFYAHPTLLAASCVFLLALLLLTSDIRKEMKFIIIIFLVLLSTLRFKAIGAAFIIMILILYVSKSNKKVSISKLGILAFLVIILAWHQIDYYYIDLDYSVRNVLNETSFKIAKDYFPIGTGFGTYASYFSALYYSPVYNLYRISGYYELQKGRIAASDVFWPMIIGQFGIIGIFCYVLILYFLFKKIQENYSITNKNLYIAKLVCLAYLIISSTSESAFVNPIAIPLAMVIGINTFNNSLNKID